jgi:hypothetical protein
VHRADEPFALISASTLRAIGVPDALLGTQVTVTAHAVGDGDGTSIASIASGEALRPPSPAHLRATISSGALEIVWVRRSRLGYAWVDSVDAPLGETAERYRIRVERASARIELETSEPAATIDAVQLGTLGSGAAEISVVTVGDRAISRAATLTISLP